MYVNGNDTLQHDISQKLTHIRLLSRSWDKAIKYIFAELGNTPISDEEFLKVLSRLKEEMTI